MTPVIEIPWPLALLVWTLELLFWVAALVIVVFVAAVGAAALILFAIGRAGYRVGERIEERRLKGSQEATTEVRR